MSKVKTIEEHLGTKILDWTNSSVANGTTVSSIWEDEDQNKLYYFGSWEPWKYRDRALYLLKNYTSEWEIKHTDSAEVEHFDELFTIKLKDPLGSGSYNRMAPAIVLAVLDAQERYDLYDMLIKELKNENSR
jgi:hypothetical protein